MKEIGSEYKNFVWKFQKYIPRDLGWNGRIILNGF